MQIDGDVTFVCFIMIQPIKLLYFLEQRKAKTLSNIYEFHGVTVCCSTTIVNYCIIMSMHSLGSRGGNPQYVSFLISVNEKYQFLMYVLFHPYSLWSA
jgi:hypothetical protein